MKRSCARRSGAWCAASPRNLRTAQARPTDDARASPHSHNARCVQYFPLSYGELDTSMTNLAVNPTILKTVPLFSLFSDHQLAALFPAIQHRSYPRHSFMLRAGEKSDALYIILSGRAKIVIDDGEGREVTLTTIGPSEFFGEMSLI